MKVPKLPLSYGNKENSRTTKIAEPSSCNRVAEAINYGNNESEEEEDG